MTVEKPSFYYCTNCGARVRKVIVVEAKQETKAHCEINIEIRAFLCEKCFKRMFNVNNWMRHWRVELSDYTIMRGKKEVKFTDCSGICGFCEIKNTCDNPKRLKQIESARVIRNE